MAVAPAPGEIVSVRSRQYFVEEVVPPPAPGEQTLVKLACLEDDAQGEPLEVLWESEVDARPAAGTSLGAAAGRGFDPTPIFAAYLRTLRWNCVTSTNPRLLQAPYRAGIEVMAYQLEPLRKALLLPRVALFIADDVGLGKTIEAGLILRELVMRQKVRRVVVACPPSVVLQWQAELESRFGLSFVVFDRAYMAARRREQGYGVNPWMTHTRFIISHALLRDEAYVAPLRDWLSGAGTGTGIGTGPGSLFILDEAHNAAPASGGRYAIDSHLTAVVRDLAPCFEHRLFLSATPHNGHSNSFAALLELLDPQRFCRGVKVAPKLRDDVVVRRLKSDLREVVGGLPLRRVVQVDLRGLPADAPELVLARLLGEYRAAREQRLEGASRKAQAAAALVTVSLQKRLLSSIEAFAQTLAVHTRAVEKLAAKAAAEVAAPPAAQPQLSLLHEAPGADDDRADLGEKDVAQEEEAQMEAATAASRAGPPLGREIALLREMGRIAGAARGRPDRRVELLVSWIREHPDRRVVVFTEYADTKRYLAQQLRAALAAEDPEGLRLATFHGGMDEEAREEIKAAFNSDPARHPLRILIATDAAREGVNLQNHCADLFHFDVPWNPCRMEQRNGRIDRKLQREDEVRCHYFVFSQRPEDRVLQVLVEKTQTIEEELGSLSPVVERRLQKLLDAGIRAEEEARLADEIRKVGPDPDERATVEEELEEARQRKKDLAAQIEGLRDMLSSSQRQLGIAEGRDLPDMLPPTLNAALEVAGAEPLSAATGDKGRGAWRFPALDQRAGADPTWADTMDTLRAPRRREQKHADWRRDSAIRPVVFKDQGTIDDDVVHLHLEHRLVRRLLGRFLAQGFVYDDLSRACVGQTRDAIPRVVLLGRISLYGSGAARLHDEVVAVAARWIAPETRRGPLRPYADDADAWRLLDAALAAAGAASVPESVGARLLASLAADVGDLQPHFDRRAEEIAERAARLLATRGEREAKDMTGILEAQRTRIERKAAEHDERQLELRFNDEERRQLEADRRHWGRRLAALTQELDREPERIRASYVVRARRVDLVGVVYLWPVTG
ncbi:MAG: helicase [Deltaproteobacteria bacterium]|nr:helicase [Deltaproteobacteria bacterium]